MVVGNGLGLAALGWRPRFKPLKRLLVTGSAFTRLKPDANENRPRADLRSCAAPALQTQSCPLSTLA
jgi:hypothetical protein